MREIAPRSVALVVVVCFERGLDSVIPVAVVLFDFLLLVIRLLVVFGVAALARRWWLSVQTSSIDNAIPVILDFCLQARIDILGRYSSREGQEDGILHVNVGPAHMLHIKSHLHS